MTFLHSTREKKYNGFDDDLCVALKSQQRYYESADTKEVKNDR